MSEGLMTLLYWCGLLLFGVKFLYTLLTKLRTDINIRREYLQHPNWIVTVWCCHSRQYSLSMIKNALTLFMVLFLTTAVSAQNASMDYLFKPGDNGYSCFRIPALLTTAKGHLLAFAEARKHDCSDSGDIDMVLKRSTNGGRTWSAIKVIWNDSLNTCGNPVPLQDATTGRILLVCCWNAGKEHEADIRSQNTAKGRMVFVIHSDDEGKTWSEPTEITAQVKLPGWTWYATGPCHGVTIKQGKFKGRLVVPVNHVERATGNNYAHVIYSDNHGISWQLGANAPYEHANETTVAQLSNGSLMLNSRSSNRQVKYRRIALSSDGGQTWEDKGGDSTLIEPICQGSLLEVKKGSKNVLLFCNPAHQTRRANLTLRSSFDDGKTWPVSYTLYSGTAAYSDIAIWKNKTVCCLYEAGIKKSNEGIVFRTVPLKQMLSSK
jgi:sialidase-1